MIYGRVKFQRNWRLLCSRGRRLPLKMWNIMIIFNFSITYETWNLIFLPILNMACKTFSRDFNSPSSVLISINLNCRVARKREIPCAFFPPEKISHATAFIIVGVHMPRSPDLAGSVHPRVEVLGRLERRQQEREWGVHISRAGISLSLSLSLSHYRFLARSRVRHRAHPRGGNTCGRSIVGE